MNHIFQSVEQIMCITQETASSSEESLATVEEQASTMTQISQSADRLSSIAVNLQLEVNQFEV
ncbi:MAG: hypothetical protein ACI35P_05345 [Bacillus sp. (in: firmicutes)]